MKRLFFLMIAFSILGFTVYPLSAADAPNPAAQGLKAPETKVPETPAPDPDFDKAYDLYNKAQYDEAIAGFAKVLERNPNHVRARAYNGVCYMGKEQFDQAIEELNKALKLDEKFPLTNYALSVSYARKATPDVAKAEEFLTNAKKYGYQVPVWFEQYVERLKKGNVSPQNQEAKPQTQQK